MDIKIEEKVLESREKRESLCRTKIMNLTRAIMQTCNESPDPTVNAKAVYALVTDAFNCGVRFEQENRGEVHNPQVVPASTETHVPRALSDKDAKAKAKDAAARL